MPRVFLSLSWETCVRYSARTLCACAIAESPSKRPDLTCLMISLILDFESKRICVLIFSSSRRFLLLPIKYAPTRSAPPAAMVNGLVSSPATAPRLESAPPPKPSAGMAEAKMPVPDKSPTAPAPPSNRPPAPPNSPPRPFPPPMPTPKSK